MIGVNSIVGVVICLFLGVLIICSGGLLGNCRIFLWKFLVYVGVVSSESVAVNKVIRVFMMWWVFMLFCWI